ncbi:MAG: sigma factor-like helix-turn-helix DNA-binding protein [Pseudomonadota bacterium]
MTLKVTDVGDVSPPPPDDVEQSSYHTLRLPAFRQLYERYFSKLVGGLRATYGAGPPDPEDVAQAAFERLSRRNALDDIRDPEGFLWIAARNVLLTEKRKLAVRSDHRDEVIRRYFSEGCDNFEPERVFSSKQQLSLVMRTLKAMPERRRKIFILNRVHGLTPAAAGEQCGVSRSSAVRHIAVATTALAAALAAQGQSDEERGE